MTQTLVPVAGRELKSGSRQPSALVRQRPYNVHGRPESLLSVRDARTNVVRTNDVRCPSPPPLQVSSCRRLSAVIIVSTGSAILSRPALIVPRLSLIILRAKRPSSHTAAGHRWPEVLCGRVCGPNPRPCGRGLRLLPRACLEYCPRCRGAEPIPGCPRQAPPSADPFRHR